MSKTPILQFEQTIAQIKTTHTLPLIELIFTSTKRKVGQKLAKTETYMRWNRTHTWALPERPQ